MGDIAGASGVTRAVLYDHFDSKKAVFLAVVEQQNTLVLGHVGARITGEGTPRERMRATMHAVFTFAERHPASTPARRARTSWTRAPSCCGPGSGARADPRPERCRYAPRTLSALPRHVQAAGGVILRDGQLCVIHRPDYEDWSLPKGKLDAGESHEDAALREVHEETGLRCRLGIELSSQDYTDRKGRPKTVRWWAMEVLFDEGLTPSREVDQRRWIPVALAETFLTYEHDRELVREAQESVAS